MNLNNTTVAIITGASSGIGRELAIGLARREVRVGLLARRFDLLKNVELEIKGVGGNALAIECDVTDRAAFERAIDRVTEIWGEIDLLINNAGRGHFEWFEETSDERIESIFRLNVFALWYGTSYVLPSMRQRRSGMIVNMSSMAGKIGFGANAAYVAAKHAVVGLTRALRAELTGSGVEAMVVLPAGVLTDWGSVTEGASMLDFFAAETKLGSTLARQMGTPPLPYIPLLEPKDVAASIIEGIESPRPEIYTHPGSEELVRLHQSNQQEAERRLEPFRVAGLRYRDGSQADER